MRWRQGVATATVAVVAVLLLAGCGSHTVPNVVGWRLDLAESTVKDAGLGYEEVDGGASGIMVRWKWTVCREEPKAGTKTSGKVKLIVDRTCANLGGGGM
jgi:beta-lactam-binding protein with PASTA domain